MESLIHRLSCAEFPDPRSGLGFLGGASQAVTSPPCPRAPCSPRQGAEGGGREPQTSSLESRVGFWGCSTPLCSAPTPAPCPCPGRGDQTPIPGRLSRGPCNATTAASWSHSGMKPQGWLRAPGSRRARLAKHRPVHGAGQGLRGVGESVPPDAPAVLGLCQREGGGGETDAAAGAGFCRTGTLRPTCQRARLSGERGPMRWRMGKNGQVGRHWPSLGWRGRDQPDLGQRCRVPVCLRAVAPQGSQGVGFMRQGHHLSWSSRLPPGH